MKKIIVVDDEPITRMDLVGMLSELGFEVVGEASDGFDAIEVCRVEKPDIVLMDVKMPIFDGLSASETILQEELATCVVLLTAYCDKEIIWRANQIGVTGYLTKPIDARSILPTLEVAYAQSVRLAEQKKQTQKMKEQMQESRQIFRAQKYLAKTQGCSETEAYQKMRKTAMDKRMSIAALAERILEQAARTDEVSLVKAYLMKTRGLREDRAYQVIVNYKRTHGCTVEEAAHALRIQWNVKGD
jgi:AmiR/NasT family two-component response regulator